MKGEPYCLSPQPSGRQHFCSKFINSGKATPQVLYYHFPVPGLLRVSQLFFLALAFLLWFFPHTACRVVLTSLTFLHKEPRQGCVRGILQCHQCSMGRAANSLYFLLKVIITFFQTLSSHVHWEPCEQHTDNSLVKEMLVASLQMVLKGAYSWVSFSDTCKEGSLSQPWKPAELNEHFLLNKYMWFYLLLIGYLSSY